MRNKMPDNLLDNIAKDALNKTNIIGYPVRQDGALRDFYTWLIDTGLCDAVLNNVGNPFKPEKHFINSLNVECEVLKFFAPLLGFDMDDFWGIITSGGTDGNNHGIYFGHTILEKKGKPILYVSKEAHYSICRLADLQNIDLRLIDCDNEGRMLAKDFEAKLDASRPALIVFALGTTFKGAIDDQKAINEVIAKKNPPAVYRHVDAALFGGYLIFDRHGEELISQNILKYDSIAISGHKFFDIDEPCGIFLCTKEVIEKQKAFEINYLNSNMLMICCSRSSLSPLKLYWLINHYGITGYKEQIAQMFENAVYLKSKLEDLGVRAWLGQHSTTVYFSRPSTAIMHKYYLASEFDENLGGELAHIVVMQHVTKDVIDGFIDDLKASL